MWVQDGKQNRYPEVPGKEEKWKFKIMNRSYNKKLKGTCM
jgi:hypothetical protein